MAPWPRGARCPCCTSRPRHHAAPGALARTLGLEFMRRGCSASLLPVSVRRQPRAGSATALARRCSKASPRLRRQVSTAAIHGSPRLSELGKFATGSLSGQAVQRRRSAALSAASLWPGRQCGFARASRPNPSLNTRPSTACRLAREALTVYAAPRGQAGPPLRAR